MNKELLGQIKRYKLMRHYRIKYLVFHRFLNSGFLIYKTNILLLKRTARENPYKCLLLGYYYFILAHLFETETYLP